MKKHLIMASLLCVVISVLALAIASRRPTPLPQRMGNMRGRSLREQAEMTGAATATARPTNLRRYDDVRALTHESDMVIVGSVKSQRSYLLPPAERIIVTDFTVNVLDVLKGDLKPTQTVTVRAPGGHVDLNNGTSVDVRMPDFWRNPEIGKSYVLFLENRNTGYFVLQGGPQGLFELTDDGMKPQVRAEDKLMQRYFGKDLASFTREVQRTPK